MPADRLRLVGSSSQLLAQPPQVGVQIRRVVRDADMVHSRRPSVGRHTREGLAERVDGVELVDQTVPFAAFDPLCEGRQHPLRPNPRFDPRPFLVRRWRLMGLSGAGSPCGHCGRCGSLGFGHRVSISLHPFAPPALPGFDATMGALTPARPACRRAGLPASRNRPSEPSVSNHRPAPMAALSPNPSAPSASPARAAVWASPLDRRLARRYGRIEFVILRMAHSPPVAPHPASRRRSYVRLQAGVGIPGEDFHPPDRMRSQAHGPGLRREDDYCRKQCIIRLNQSTRGCGKTLECSHSRARPRAAGPGGPSRGLPASPESKNTDPRNQWLGLCSWLPGLALKGHPGTTAEFSRTPLGY